MLAGGALGGAALVAPVGPARVGVGVNPDIALRSDWRYCDAPGATIYGVRANSSEILLLRGDLVASWQVAPTLSVGGSVGALYNENQLRAPFVFQSQPVLRGAKTLFDLKTDGFGWNAQAAARWRPVPAVALSATYSGLAGGEYSRGVTEVDVQWFSLTATVGF